MAAKRTDTAGSRAGRELARMQRDNLQRIHKRWCELNPERAAEERALRKQLREQEDRFGHKVNGTVETHGKASIVRQGALARLHRTGAITIEQLGAALEIAAAHDRVAMDVTVRSGWGFDRVDVSRNPEAGFFEALGAVRTEVAYSLWRRALTEPGPVLAMIVEDCGIAAAARRFHMHTRRAGRLLVEALDLWSTMHRRARDRVDEASLAAAHAWIL